MTCEACGISFPTTVVPGQSTQTCAKCWGRAGKSPDNNAWCDLIHRQAVVDAVWVDGRLVYIG